jgi:radical SAM superfamily enzyme YgiQ (UPF0313 family)
LKILLIQPRPKGGLGLTGLSCFEPLGLEAIAAPLQGAHDLKLIDHFSTKDLSRTLSAFEPDICAISSSFAMDVDRTLRLAEHIKSGKRQPLVVVGGHHASLSPADFHKPFIDAMVIGEGEVTFTELVNALEHNGDLMDVPGLALNRDGEQVFTAQRDLIKDLDELPLPARHLSKPFRKLYFFGFEHPVAMVETTRGCPYRCTFCSVHKFFRDTVRFKSPERVVEELANLGENKVFFCDDNFFIDVHRALQTATLIKEHGIRKRYYIQARSDTIVSHSELIPLWKDVGLEAVFVGFECTNEEGLRIINKRNTIANNEKALEILYSHGIGVTASFIVNPDDTAEDFANLRRYIERLRIKTIQFSVLTPFPGTDLFTQVRDKIVAKKCELFDGLHTVLPTKLPLPKFYEEFSGLYANSFEHSVVGRVGIRDAINRFRTGQLSLSQMRRMAKTAQMLADANCYLSAHT